MAAAAGRGGGAHTMNFIYFKPMLRKAYHKKSTSPEMISETVKMNAEEVKNKSVMNHDCNCWVPDERTGIFYPKGQEKVMEDVPPEASKDFGRIHWFSSHEG